MNNKAFTLIEVLVSIAIIGILLVVSASIFSSTIRSTNKATVTAEAKENASLLVDSFESDVRPASSVSIPSADTLILTSSAGQITWRCRAQSGKNNAYVSRQVDTGSERTLTNRDSLRGISWKSCSFAVSGGGSSYLVEFVFNLTEGAGVQGANQDLSVSVPNRVSVATRGF